MFLSYPMSMSDSLLISCVDMRQSGASMCGYKIDACCDVWICVIVF